MKYHLNTKVYQKKTDKWHPLLIKRTSRVLEECIMMQWKWERRCQCFVKNTVTWLTFDLTEALLSSDTEFDDGLKTGNCLHTRNHAPKVTWPNWVHLLLFGGEGRQNSKVVVTRVDRVGHVTHGDVVSCPCDHSRRRITKVWKYGRVKRSSLLLYVQSVSSQEKYLTIALQSTKNN